MNVAVTVCASAWITLKQIDSVARALTVSPTAQNRFKIAAIVGLRLAEIAILTATVLWATGSKMVAQDVERCQLTCAPDIFSGGDLIDEEPWEYGEDPSLDEDLPAFPGDVEVTAEPDAVDLGAEFAAVSAYWQCGLRAVQLSVDEVALVEAALAVA
jgi:hypothetical protein